MIGFQLQDFDRSVSLPTEVIFSAGPRFYGGLVRHVAFELLRLDQAVKDLLGRAIDLRRDSHFSAVNRAVIAEERAGSVQQKPSKIFQREPPKVIKTSLAGQPFRDLLGQGQDGSLIAGSQFERNGQG